MAKKTLYTLAVDGYSREITDLTFPFLRHYAHKIGADFHVIDERKFHGWPVTVEKLQVYELAKKAGDEWAIFFDADALVHPETIDWTAFIPKDTVAHNGSDFASVRWRYDNYFLRDGRNIGSCFEAGTVVAGAGAIEAIKDTETVVNRTGHRQAIKHRFSRLFTGEMINLKVAYLPNIRITADHPVLACTARGKYHHTPNPISGAKAWIEFLPNEPEWVAAKNLTRDHWVMVPRVVGGKIGEFSFNRQGGPGHPGKRQTVTAKVDSDFAWLLGLYVAEGYVSEGNRLNLSLGAHEGKIAARALATLRNLSVNARLSRTPSGTSAGVMSVIASCAGLARLLDEWCGHGAELKKIPQVIAESPELIVRSFIDGLIAGDGCIALNKRGSSCYRLVTISKELALDVVRLLLRLGIRASCGNPRKNSSTIQGRIVNAKPVYEINWSVRAWTNERTALGCLPYGAAKFVGDYAYLPVRKISSEHVRNLPVFNIETEDETYGVPFIVHNCNWCTMASDLCLDLWHPPDDITCKEALDAIYPTATELGTVITVEHLFDDYLLSRNIAKFGLKFTTLMAVQKRLGLSECNFLWHAYILPTHEKVKEIKAVIAKWEDPEQGVHLDIRAKMLRG